MPLHQCIISVSLYPVVLSVYPKYHGCKHTLLDGTRIDYQIDQIQTNDNQTASGIIDLFVDCLVEKKEPEISGANVLHAMKAVFASIESSAKGCVIEVK